MIDPSIVKVFFYFFLKFLFYELTFVEGFEDAKEFCKVVALVEILIKSSSNIKHIYKITHNNRKDSNSKKHTKSHKQPLSITHRMEVTKSNCGKSGKCKVVKLKDLIKFVHVIEAITWFEIAVCASTLSQSNMSKDILLNFKDHFENHTEEEAYTCYDDEETEGF